MDSLACQPKCLCNQQDYGMMGLAINRLAWSTIPKNSGHF
jgi:hypothetical protein